MPTYDGIGSSITHRVEVVGDSLFQDVDGGTLSTKVPVQIFSNYYASPGSVDSSRQLRFRVQSDGESNVSNSYVTDMGVKGADGSNYFFITAPQNTSNVGDQNTFVISTTSNVGIGTTDPTKTLEVIGDIKCQTLSASTITGASPLVIESDETIVIRAPIQMPAEAPMQIGTMTVSNIFHSDQLTMSANVFVTEGSTLTLSNIFHTDQLTMTSNIVMGSDKTLTTSNITHDSELTITSNLLMGSDKTLTTSNIVANSGENLSLNSNLFVDTSTGRVGIGVASPTKKLDVNGSVAVNGNGNIYFNNQIRQHINLWGTDYGIGVQNSSSYFRTGGNFFFYKGGSHNDSQGNAGSGGSCLMSLASSGNVGIGTASPLRKLDVRSGTSSASDTNNWISGAFGPQLNAGDRVVIGNLWTKATIGAHNSALDAWADLTINSGGGNVGVGTASPGHKFTVNGTNAVTGNNAFYHDQWGGGWFMQDSSYMRVYNDKHIYTGGYLRSGSCYIYSSYQFYGTYWSNIPITSERGTFLVMVQGASNDISCAVFACTDDSGWDGGSVNVLSRQTDYGASWAYFDMQWPGGDTNRNLQIRHTAYFRACYITVLRVA
jgi:hypothetical protein